MTVTRRSGRKGFFSPARFASAVLAACCLAGLASAGNEGEAWNSYAVGETGLAVEAPGELVRDEIAIPSDARRRVSAMDSYSYGSDGFALNVSSVAYAVGVKADMKDAEAGVVGGIRGLKGATGLVYESRPAVVAGKSAVLLSGSFKRSGAAWEFKAALLNDGQSIHQVTAVYEAVGNRWAPAAQRVLDSITTAR